MEESRIQLRRIAETFENAFGKTPLNERLADVLAQAVSISRLNDLSHVRSEAGDLLCSVLQLCNECELQPEQLVDQTLTKIGSRTELYRSLGRKLRVALYRDDFDPIHNGHLQVAQEALGSGKVDEVWLMPCFDQLGKESFATAEMRLHMCRLAAEQYRGLSVFDYEIRNRFRGEPYHLVRKLMQEEIANERCDFSMIINQDSADMFSSWTNHEALERLISFIVIPGAGCVHPRSDAWYLEPPHRFLAAAQGSSAISSTQVRSMVVAKDARLRERVPATVFDWILSQHLYESIESDSPKSRLKIAIYSGSFDPPTRSQRLEVELLLQNGFDEVIVCPVVPRSAVREHEHASPMHRAALATLGFRGLDRVSIDYDDISQNRYTSPLGIEARHQGRGEIWHVVSTQQVDQTGGHGSMIQTQWEDGEKLWREARFVILTPPNSTAASNHRPPNAMVVHCPEQQTPAEVRQSVFARSSIAELTLPLVNDYVDRHNLFVPYSSQRCAYFQVPKPRVHIVADPRNLKSQAVANQYRPYQSDDPNLILVLGGDGTMLHAIREYWRMRVPFLGVNTGHLGFLMNERLPTDLTELDLVSYTLPMLRVDTETPNGEHAWGLAFSDVWLERADGQAAWFRLDVDGETRVSKVVGDGMLIATASGSSAYARAMGATPIPLNTPTVTLVGSNIFQPRFWKPMALPDDSLITIASLDRSGKRPVRGYIDGTPTGAVQQITVRRSLTASVEMAFTREFDPSARLLRSLFPPVES